LIYASSIFRRRRPAGPSLTEWPRMTGSHRRLGGKGCRPVQPHTVMAARSERCVAAGRSGRTYADRSSTSSRPVIYSRIVLLFRFLRYDFSDRKDIFFMFATRSGRRFETHAQPVVGCFRGDALQAGRRKHSVFTAFPATTAKESSLHPQITLRTRRQLGLRHDHRRSHRRNKVPPSACSKQPASAQGSCERAPSWPEQLTLNEFG